MNRNFDRLESLCLSTNDGLYNWYVLSLAFLFVRKENVSVRHPKLICWHHAMMIMGGECNLNHINVPSKVYWVNTQVSLFILSICWNLFHENEQHLCRSSNVWQSLIIANESMSSLRWVSDLTPLEVGYDILSSLRWARLSSKVTALLLKRHKNLILREILVFIIQNEWFWRTQVCSSHRSWCCTFYSSTHSKDVGICLISTVPP